ncbi:MAG: DUF4926 domain-containing protein [Streptococcaceae bacterium]|nr:DUF4926 domain-containing protein [Streptococcaceae bacterium]
MFNENDMVIAKKALAKEIPAGTKGCIMLVYMKPAGYEVEFFDEDNNTIVFPNGDITLGVGLDDIDIMI